MDFSKIESGKLEVEERPLYLREHVGNLLKGLATRVQGKELELVSDIATDVPDALTGDPGRLRQVLWNLVGNAVKFTERGEVVLRIRRQTSTPTGVILSFEVADTGIDVPADKQDAIFDAFVQADASTTRRYGGTGLGLSIASRLVDAMGGEISVASEPGRGSTFRFTARLGVREGPQPTPSGAVRELQGLRTLVVDDNTTNRRILSDMLRRWGLAVHSAPGAAAALDRLRGAVRRGKPVMLVILDVQMPDVDGFELAAALKNDATLGHPITILLTSGGRHGDQARLERAGVAAFLVKPVKQSELLETIQSVMGVSRTPEVEPHITEPLTKDRRLRVLVAEDSLANQRLAVGMLEKYGHAVTVVSTGAEAVDACSSEAFDVVVMDLQMPEMDGFDALRAIREREAEASRPAVPIVALTARAAHTDKQECLAAGFDGYLAKPYRSLQLLEAIDGCVRPSPRTTTTEPAGDANRLDWKTALSTLDGDAQLLREVAEGFLGQQAVLVTELENALRECDYSVAGRVAHTIGGLAAAVRGSSCRRVCIRARGVVSGGRAGPGRAGVARAQDRAGVGPARVAEVCRRRGARPSRSSGRPRLGGCLAGTGVRRQGPSDLAEPRIHSALRDDQEGAALYGP